MYRHAQEFILDEREYWDTSILWAPACVMTSFCLAYQANLSAIRGAYCARPNQLPCNVTSLTATELLHINFSHVTFCTHYLIGKFNTLHCWCRWGAALQEEILQLCLLWWCRWGVLGIIVHSLHASYMQVRDHAAAIPAVLLSLVVQVWIQTRRGEALFMSMWVYLVCQ